VNEQRRIALVTGGNSGIGFAWASAMGARGFEVILACRSEERGLAARQRLRAENAQARAELVLCDLLSFASIRSAAAEVRDRWPHVDVLFNNAGAVFFDRGLSVDGHERNTQVYFLGPHLLTEQLLPALSDSPAGRIINMVGRYAYKGRWSPDDPELANRFSGIQAAANGQLYKLMATVELAERLAPQGVTVNAYHPGAVRTAMVKKLPWHLRMLATPVSWFFRTPSGGADTAVWLASSPELQDATGAYYFDRKLQALPPDAASSEARAQLMTWAQQQLAHGAE
jgi:NAD(P)-dependent dehydrogenase (short-subunit alcohol dehydrogenase family)